MSKKRHTLRHTRGSLKNLENLNKAFTKTSRRRGNINEGVVDEILVELKNEKEILDFKKNWDLDKIGIDQLVCLPNGEKFAIQDKSSPKGARKHYKKYGTLIDYKHRKIQCLVLIVNSGHLIDRSDLKRDIKNFINEHF